MSQVPGMGNLECERDAKLDSLSELVDKSSIVSSLSRYLSEGFGCDKVHVPWYLRYQQAN